MATWQGALTPIKIRVSQFRATNFTASELPFSRPLDPSSGMIEPMGKSLKAVYENGVLRPLDPAAFREHQVISLTVCDLAAATEALLDADFLRHCETLADDSVTIEQVRAALAKIPGSL